MYANVSVVRSKVSGRLPLALLQILLLCPVRSVAPVLVMGLSLPRTSYYDDPLRTKSLVSQLVSTSSMMMDHPSQVAVIW